MHVLAFILGLCVGSFINAAVYRINPAGNGGVIQKKGPSLLKGRSICPHCRKQLAWWQLIPLLSFVILRGRCHECGKKISFQYPFVEILTGLSFLLYFIYNPASYGKILLGLAVISLLIFIALYDFKKYLILDTAIISGIALAVLWQIGIGSWQGALLSAAALTGFFALIYAVSKGGWIGFGDVKLAFFLGLLFGPLVFVVLLLASWLGTIVGVFLMAKRKGNLKTELPFGTFLAISSVAVLVWQAQIETFLNQFYL